MKNTKFVSVAIGAALAVAWCFAWYNPVPVHADFGNFIDEVDYIEALEGDEAVALSSGGGAAVAGALLGVYLCTRNPLLAGGYYDGGNVTVISGLYKYNDVVRLGYEFFTDQHDLSNDAPHTFATAYDFEIGVTGSISSYHSAVSYNRYFSLSFGSTSNSNLAISNFRGNGLFTQGSYSARGNPPDYYYYFGGNLSTSGGQYKDWDRYPNTSLSDIFYYEPVDANNVIQVTSRVTLPSGELDPANPDVYIENVLRPWVVENYPEYIYLLPEPEPQPTETLDPSETMPGLPVIELPTVPAPDYDMELPEKMLEGAGFWFTALTSVLEELGWLSIVIVLAVVAIVLYYVF